MLKLHKIISHLKIIVRNYTPRRALMYVPGDDEKKLNKVLTNLDVDCIAMDCEDGVAYNKKVQARTTIKSILNKGKPLKKRNYDLGVRVNSIDSEFFIDDLKECLTAGHLPDTVLLPKVDHIDHLKLFSDLAKKLIPDEKKINLIVYIESAWAFINLVKICEFSVNLLPKIIVTTLVFGSDDFCANIGITRTDSSIETLYARQKLVLIAKAFNLQAIDMVYIKYKDLEGLKRQCLEGANMGFTGKQIIHPNQISIVQDTFLPTKEKINWAIGLLNAFNEHQKIGKGAFSYEGLMIDLPTVKQARNIVNLINSIKEN